ncbi:FAD-dependent monooxygenase [Dichotomicrobium thermohalophilum]|uniref:2-octaprenyl-3-methyl-6-methoxy-1,4-benzoquinol hydroxylase n=1 Tax=Dichotomicrobium thermohalophilum TaxID=933063 RepID=A0A397Q6Y8_9HYPH|nr:FAD-dependent monooxygenase [Dichotomicrobium thermohalophilum]RIA55555.1 2-octaprenyl-3-methyl-6-methoxy-1,4-benzoquinol hydroxylase [Dichotomicrobium thermohalophilum]
MAHDYDIVIGGGGFIGLTLARALSVAAPGLFRVAVVDPAPPERLHAPNNDGRAMTISAASRRMLETLGVWADVAEDAQPVNRIEITDTPLDSPVRLPVLQFDTVDTADGPAAHVVENAVLMRALATAVEDSGATLIAPESIEGIETRGSGVAVRLGSGRESTARLVVAADGRRSRLRRMAGIKAITWDYPQVGIVTTVEHEHPHWGRAVQHFLPAGPFAMLPMTGRRCSLVWTEAPKDAERMLALDEGRLNAEITRRFGGELGEVRVISPLQTFPLSLSMARDFVKPGVALIGDAAHGLHWLAGQGLNHGLRDVAALTEVLVEARRIGEDIGQVNVLRRYERWRRFDSSMSAAGMDALNRLFANDNRTLRMVRTLGLGMVDRLAPLKRLFVAEAAGTTGELPRLMRGERI